MRNWIPRFCVSVLLTASLGCGAEKKFAVTGTVTRGGEKLTWPDGGTLLVIYFPEDRIRDKNVYRAETNIETSSYAVTAIPPGRYKVAVQQFNLRHKDTLNDAYDPVQTTITKEVTQDGQTHDIDIPASEGKQPRPEKAATHPPE